MSVYIVSGYRSPIGAFNGQFKNVSIYDVAKPVIEVAISESGFTPEQIDEVIIGNVLTAGKGQNPARQAALASGIPQEVPAITINMLCGSGLKAVALAYNAIKAGDASIVLAGGMESMTQAEHTILMRKDLKIGDASLKDSLLNDGLIDAINKVHMGLTAEEVAARFNVTREEQDAFALKSQQKTSEAVQHDYFLKEIVGITTSKGELLLKDEFPRPQTTMESLSKLRPAFTKTGSVTAGNASGINDGAAFFVLASEAAGGNRLARIVGHAQCGNDPMIMGVAPIVAVKKLLQKIQWEITDVDLFELNEAFASQSVVVARELKIPDCKVNVTGGAIALGHPIGASGARVLVTLTHNLRRLGLKRGVAALCVGGGMGIALAIEIV